MRLSWLALLAALGLGSAFLFPLLWPTVFLAQPPPGGGDERFGMVLVPPDPTWLSLAHQAGARVNRFQLNWWDVAPTPGSPNFQKADHEIDTILAGGLDVALIVTAPPQWARRADSQWVPIGLELPWDDPANHWGQFVHATVSHFKGRVRYYEFYNEPDNPDFWDAAPEDYARLLMVAYHATKAADPDAQVIMAGFAHWTEPLFAEQVLGTLRLLPDAEAHGYFFDIAAWHWYSRADQLYNQVRWAQALLDRYGMAGKPIWVNETNISVWGDGAGPQEPTWGFGSPSEQAAFIVQAYTNAFAAGVERVFVFRLHDNEMTETFGLLRDDGTPRPAYHAYATTSRWLSGARFITRHQRDDVIVTIFRRPPDEKITVAWALGENPTSVLLEAVGDEAMLVNLLGESRTVTPNNGHYHLGLDAGTTYTRPGDGKREQLVAGPPVFLIERDRTPPTASMRPLPALSASSTLHPHWAGYSHSDDQIAHYELQVSTDRGPWRPWVTTSALSGTFEAPAGHHYAFRVRAIDTVGRVSEWPPAEQPMATTSVGGAIVGTLSSAQAWPFALLPVCVEGTNRCAWSDEAGFFRLSPLAPGPTTIRVFLGTTPGSPTLTTTVPVTLGHTSDLGRWHLSAPRNVLSDGGMHRLGAAWSIDPIGGASVLSTESESFARLRPGARLLQRVVIPAVGSPTLRLRYRLSTPGTALQVGLHPLVGDPAPHYTQTLPALTPTPASPTPPVGAGGAITTTLPISAGAAMSPTLPIPPPAPTPSNAFPTPRLLVYNDQTTDGWHELELDISEFSGQDMILDISAPLISGTAVLSSSLDIDTVVLGASAFLWHTTLPVVIK